MPITTARASYATDTRRRRADLFRAGYLVEFAADGDGDGVPDADGDGVGDGDGTGDGDGVGSGDGGATPVPIPAAALTFPGTALLAYFVTRRMKKR